MSEWNIVTKKNKRIYFKSQSESSNSESDKKQEFLVKKKIREEKKSSSYKRERWEASRQSKIDEYNREFPLLPNSHDAISDKDKIIFIETRNEAKRKADHEAFLVREARREAKRKIVEEKAKQKAKREAELAEIAEHEHVQNMIEKWGAHRWYRMVEHTTDDCDTAWHLRVEEEDREWERDRYQYQLELELAEKEKRAKEELEIYIAFQTANMKDDEKAQWLSEFEEQEQEDSYHAFDDGGCSWYLIQQDENYLKWQRDEDDKRLATWYEKQAKNNN